MNTLYQQLAGESVGAALQRLESEIKSRPADADLRAAFVQFLCLSGNWRARWRAKKLAGAEAAGPANGRPAGTEHSGRAAARCGICRQRRPQMPDSQWPWLSALASALCSDSENAQRQRLAAFEQTPLNPGNLNQADTPAVAFHWLMDGDARLGPVCELIVNGRYCWLPFAAIAEIRFQAPASVTDLVWRHALVRLTDGSEQVCQIPARYPVTPQAEARFQLGRATEWQPLDDEGALYQGHGQKVWLNDNDEFPILSLDVVSFA